MQHELLIMMDITLRNPTWIQVYQALHKQIGRQFHALSA